MLLKTKTDSKDTKKPALFLWLLCHISLVIFPLASLILNLLTKLGGMAYDFPAMILSTLIAYQINSLYSKLDHEVTQYVLNNPEEDTND